MTVRTAVGKSFRILNIINEYTTECLAMRVDHHISSQDIIVQLYDLFLFRLGKL
jgi:hypothetical protein